MSEELLDDIRGALDGQIDFKGQTFAELIQNIVMSIFGIAAFIYGYINQDIRSALFIVLGGAIVTIILVVPQWPFYRRNPVTWLPAGTGIQTYQSLLEKDE
ncbi:hypothetical protein Cpir12675_003135 [Ceratocystis pirilliformis]|uniref:Signal peptidase complex subunit 1 n=1 Tax=Ceratocystis pirilliformis TaxID=259994 RepID=A0ABR3Z895_9PEZI